MGHDEITTKIKDILKKSFNIFEPKLDFDLRQQIDSLDTVELVIRLEDEFYIVISDKDWSEATKGQSLTLAFLTKFVSEKTSNSM